MEGGQEVIVHDTVGSEAKVVHLKIGVFDIRTARVGVCKRPFTDGTLDRHCFVPLQFVETTLRGDTRLRFTELRHR